MGRRPLNDRREGLRMVDDRLPLAGVSGAPATGAASGGGVRGRSGARSRKPTSRLAAVTRNRSRQPPAWQPDLHEAHQGLVGGTRCPIYPGCTSGGLLMYPGAPDAAAIAAELELAPARA